MGQAWKSVPPPTFLQTCLSHALSWLQRMLGNVIKICAWDVGKWLGGQPVPLWHKILILGVWSPILHLEFCYKFRATFNQYHMNSQYEVKLSVDPLEISNHSFKERGWRASRPPGIKTPGQQKHKFYLHFTRCSTKHIVNKENPIILMFPTLIWRICWLSVK